MKSALVAYAAVGCIAIGGRGIFGCRLAAADTPATAKSAEQEPTRDGRTLSDWIQALKDHNTRDLAIKKLGEFGAVAVPVLIREATAKNSYYRPDAIEALAAVGAPGIDPMLKAVREQIAAEPAVEYALARAGRPALPALVRLLKDKNDFMQAFAALTITRMGPAAEDAVPTLIELLKLEPAPAQGASNRRAGTGDRAGLPASAYAPNRSLFLGALAAIGPNAKAAVPMLIEVSHEPVPNRIQAVEALGKIGPAASAAVPRLVVLLRDKVFLVRMRSASALALIGPPAAKGAVPTLIRNARKEPIPEWREAAADAVKKIDPEAAARAGIK